MPDQTDSRPDASRLIQDRIIQFIEGIGLAVEARTLPDPTILPGISVDHGVLVFDSQKLAYPGDLLHEAGHLAVVPKAVREVMTGDMSIDGALEMSAIAWSYAATIFLGLPVEVLFHPAGYKGASSSLCENFSNGRYFGVPILEWQGMTDYQRPGASDSASRYPVMKKWLCD